MNTTLSTVLGRHRPPPPAVEENENPHQSAHQPVRAPGLPHQAPSDRPALRVALVRWGGRPQPRRAVAPDLPGATLARQNRERTAERERAAVRQYLLMTTFR